MHVIHGSNFKHEPYFKIWLEIGKSSYKGFKNVKSIKNGARMHLALSLTVEETLAMEESNFWQQLMRMITNFVLFFPFYFI